MLGDVTVRRDLSMLNELKALGVDTDSAVARMNGNENLYIRMLGKFLDMMKNTTIPAEFTVDDCEDLAEVAHAVKGTSGNLSITPIYEAYSEITELLRQKKAEEAKAVLLKTLPVQKDILDCIEKYA